MNGFEPIFDENSKILILGSFPSVISRKVEFYYGNPQNKFWRILGHVFDVQLTGFNKNQKTEFLLKNNIALWDIAASAEISGSSDADIKNNYQAVDLDRVLSVAKNLKVIMFNGKKAQEIYLAHYSHLQISTVLLQSTSPANAAAKNIYEDYKNKLLSALNC